MPPKAVPADSTTVVNPETADAPRCRISLSLDSAQGGEGFPAYCLFLGRAAGKLSGFGLNDFEFKI